MLTRRAFPVALLLLASCGAAADPLKRFTSMNAELPIGDLAFPPGPGADAINDHCLTCHSAEMVLNQPPLSRAAWQTEVDKMRHVYAAPIADEDARRIVEYLVATKGSG